MRRQHVLSAVIANCKVMDLCAVHSCLGGYSLSSVFRSFFYQMPEKCCVLWVILLGD